MKIMSGAYRMDAGEVRIQGRDANIQSPRDALARVEEGERHAGGPDTDAGRPDEEEHPNRTVRVGQAGDHVVELDLVALGGRDERAAVRVECQTVRSSSSRLKT